MQHKKFFLYNNIKKGFTILRFILLFVAILYADNITFLNKSEQNWLKNHTITIGITQIPNQVLVTKNGYTGFSIDLFKLMEKKLHTKFKYVYFPTWSKLLEAGKKHKIDVIFAAQRTPSRFKYFYFTDTILTQVNKILTTPSHNITSIKDLFGKKVAVTKGSAIEEFIKTNYPQIKIIPTKSELQSLSLLNSNQVYASIAEAVRASYYIKKLNLNNIVPSIDLGYNYFLSIATNNQKPILNTILNKTINNIPKDTLKALQLKWGYITEKVIDKKTLIFMAIILTITIIFVVYLSIINKKLKKEIKEKEEALQRIKQLRDEKLNQMSNTINMIAHQWKQPLSALAMINEMVIASYKKGILDDKLIDYFKTNYKKQIQYMTKTIEDFKEFFKIEEQKQEFSIKETIDAAIEISKETLNKENIEILTDIKIENQKIIGYPEALKQIFLNIIYNAKDAFKDKENKYIKITAYEKDNNIVITIKDNAGGIPIEIIDKVFDPYFTTKEKNGTGLGLYMAKVILEERMDGSIDVRNVDFGAEFIITLPKAF